MTDKISVFSKLVHLEIDLLEKPSSIVNQTIDEERSEIEGSVSEEDDGIEFYADELQDLLALKSLSAELKIVGLYRLIEINTKLALRWKLSADKVEGAYRVDELEKLLQKERGQT